MPTTNGVLLDTHTWIWLCSGSGQLSKQTVSAINTAARLSHLTVSVISVWEVGVLASKKRALFEPSVEAWVEAALSLPGLTLSPITSQIALASSFLPGGLHGDPADRIIVATARLHDLVLLTRDRLILRYGASGHVHCKRA
jgi:PIN domain nuclease of toxin-antitoxin system